MLRRRFIIEWIVVLAFALFGALAFQFSLVGRQVDNLIFDQAVAWRTNGISEQIIIVEFDEESLSMIGAWPWNRSNHANLIRQLSAAQVSAIGYDVLFTEPTNAQDDETLRAAIQMAQNVVLPAYVETPGKNGRAAEFVLPIESLAKAARAVGHVNARFDEDGIVRRSFGALNDGQRQLAHFTHELTKIAVGKANRDGAMLIPFHRAGSFQRVSAGRVLAREVPAKFLKGKIVLVGASALGLGDTLPVPGSAGSVMSGVEVQANMLNAELSGTAISTPSALAKAVGVVITLCGLLFYFWRSRPTACLLAATGLAAMALIVSGVALTFLQIWLPPSGLLVGTLLSYPLWSWRRLSALNSFVENETRELHSVSNAPHQMSVPNEGLDAVAQAAAALKSVIGNLQEMKSFMALVIENAPDAIAVLDPTGRVAMTNAKAVALFESGFENALFANLLARLAPESKPNADELALPDGRFLMLKSSSFGVEDDHAAGSIVRLADVTEQRAAQQQRDEMLEFLSHDMRSPQAAIVALIDHHSPSADTEFPAQRVRQHALASLKLADDFVQLAKLANIEPSFEEIDVVGLVNEAIDRCYIVAKNKRISIVRPSDLEDPFALADGSMLLRAFVNLIDNAVKYSGEQTSVQVSASPAPDTIDITITDFGPGIPKERLASLFQRFGASDTSGKMSAGLGLAYVKRAVDLHGGTIECASDQNGTRFQLRVPRSHDV